MHSSLVNSSASALAEMTSCVVLAPAEVIKQNAQMLRQQSQTTASTSFKAFQQLGSREAPRRLFTGYTALVARNLPFTAMQFPMFEHLRARLWEHRLRDRPDDMPRGMAETGLIAAASASSAGALAAFLTTPSDVVKTRMMLTADKGPKETVWVITKKVYLERGVFGFFRGGMFRSGWTAVGSGLYLGTYDAAKLWLRRDDASSADEVKM